MDNGKCWDPDIWPGSPGRSGRVDGVREVRPAIGFGAAGVLEVPEINPGSGSAPVSGSGVSSPAAVSGFMDGKISECCMILAGIVLTGFGDVLYLIRSKQMNRGKLHALFKEIYCFKDWNMLI